MDILAHALYGVTCFSRTGLAGGRKGAPAFRSPVISDWTFWAAAGFGILPDMTSIGLYFGQLMISGEAPDFHSIPSYVYVLYHCTHSLVTAGLIILLLGLFVRHLAVPALAWPLHIIMDSFSHGEGRWQTLILYPVSDWHFNGVNWWQHPHLILCYWGVLPVVWAAIFIWRWRSRGRSKANVGRMRGQN